MNSDSESQFSQHALATNDAVQAEDSHSATEMIPNVAELDASESNKSEAQLQLFKDIEDWLKEFQQIVLKAQDSEPPADIVIAFEDVRAKMEGFLNEQESSDWMLKLAMAISQFASDIQEDYEDIEKLAQITLRFQRNVSMIKADAGLGNDVIKTDENSAELSHSEVVTKALETQSPLPEKSSPEKELDERDETGNLDYIPENYWDEEDAIQSHESLEKVQPEFTGAESEGAEVDNAQAETHTQTPTESDILNRLSPQINQIAEESEINLPPAMPEKGQVSSVKDPASPKESLRSESSQDLIPQNQSFQEESGKEEPPKDDYTKQKCFETDTTDNSDTDSHNDNMHKPSIEFQLHKTNNSELEAQANEAVNLELGTQTDKAHNMEAEAQANITDNLEVEAQVNEADRFDTKPQMSSPVTENTRNATLKNAEYFEKFLELPKKQPEDPRNPGVMEDLSKMPRKGLVKQRVEAMEREQAKRQAQEYAYMKERRGLSDSDQEMPR